MPIFCVIDDFTSDDLASSYNTARIHMMRRNDQFYVHNAGTGRIDEESIRQTYKIVNVINYAVANDGVIPFFQGIYDNKEKRIHHYESLMRLSDENGKIYYPDSFLDVARAFGMLYDSISKIMIRKVFTIFRDISDASVSVNLSMRDIKNRELFARSSAHAVFPVFYGLNIYGILICDLTDEVYDNGEFNAAQIGLAIYTTDRHKHSSEPDSTDKPIC